MAGPSSVPVIRYDLASYGVVTAVVNATTFRVAGLAGQGDGAFQDYAIYVLKKANGTVTAPHGEQQVCAGYTSLTGQFLHAAFTANLAVGDAVLLLHPNLFTWVGPEIDSYPGTTTANWQAAEANVTTIGGIGVINKIHSLWLDINALAGTITVRLYHDINAVQRRVYQQNFTVAADGPGIWLINGTLGINGLLVITAQSDNAADNGQAVPWQYILEATA